MGDSVNTPPKTEANMTTQIKVQIRGNCQCCLRDHAILKTGLMSKHGYEVRNGWFNGVCSGQYHKPIQHDRAHTDAIAVMIREEAVRLLAYATALRNGSTKPTLAPVGGWTKAKVVSFDEAPEHMKAETIRKEIDMAESRAKSGRQLADQMQAFADEVHGTPLREVEIEPGPPAVRIGEVRKGAGGTLTLTSTQIRGARVYWLAENDRTGWMSTQSWRKLPSA